MENIDVFKDHWLEDSNNSGEFLTNIIKSGIQVRPQTESIFKEIQRNRNGSAEEMKLVARKQFFNNSQEIVNVYGLPDSNKKDTSYVVYYVEIINLCGMNTVKEFFVISMSV